MWLPPLYAIVANMVGGTQHRDLMRIVRRARRWAPRAPQGQPALLTMLLVWFFCAFAPLVCILHCHLISPRMSHAAMGHAHHLHSQHTDAHTASAPDPAAHCAALMAQPAPQQGPAQPAPLPRVIHEAVLATLALLLASSAPAAWRRRQILHPTPWSPLPHTPPPKALQRTPMTLSFA